MCQQPYGTQNILRYLYKRVKDPNIVASMSGHKEGSKAFARYREIDKDIKRDALKVFEAI